MATTRSQSARRRRFKTSGRIRPVVPFPAAAASIVATSASIWPTATTWCPARARPNAIARPSPRKPPVTIAIRCSIKCLRPDSPRLARQFFRHRKMRRKNGV